MTLKGTEKVAVRVDTKPNNVGFKNKTQVRGLINEKIILNMQTFLLRLAQTQILNL